MTIFVDGRRQDQQYFGEMSEAIKELLHLHPHRGQSRLGNPHWLDWFPTLTWCVSCVRLSAMLAAFLAVGAILASGAQADPSYGGPLLYGFDPVIRATDDPRLLGPERLVMRDRLRRLGIDPLKDAGRRPDAHSIIRRKWLERGNIDLVRRQRLLEYNGPLNVVTEISYPSYFAVLQVRETLPDGFVWYPPRALDAPEVDLFVDDIERFLERRHVVRAVLARTDALDVTGGGKKSQDTNLINLTIPIKLPRTLEKIIGRGEKTRIKITGRERISLSGESTVVKPFVPSERISSQSLFPTLDMEQELQINLSGTIGEKIIIEVDHNSAAIGPDATKIKLMYRGLEDEIIRTIETGDVGLTLPGSQLLGYGSNKTGLFGLKVTGQVGRADFTVVASKQKAESSSKSFNAQGGQVSDNVILSSEYLNNRFFKLDLPEDEESGRRNGERIRYNSVKIFQLMPPGQRTSEDIDNVAVYVDLLGFRKWADSVDFLAPHDYGPRWREITAFDPMLDESGSLIAVDMRRRMDDADVLAVVYDVENAQQIFVGSVGDNPDVVLTPVQTIPGTDGAYYRMKLLKAATTKADPRVFKYVLRNIYSLGGANIDPTSFDFRIERTGVSVDRLPFQDNSGLDFIRIFGLDRTNRQGGTQHDGVVDFHDPLLFDLTKGLLKFPLDFPKPFAADPDQYTAYADSSVFDFEASYLADNLAAPLYDSGTLPNAYPEWAKFRLIAKHASASSSFNLGSSNIEEGSETVTLDGRTLTRDVDYEIDYTFGEVQLKGDAANLTPDSKVSIDYQYSPFFGGGNTSLMGFNLGYDFGRDSKLAATVLYQSEAIVGEKAKLGEEPSKSLVGNLNLQHTFKPYFLTHVANFLGRKDSERESSLQFSGEVALSVPNPNTKGQVYLEDFEGVDASDAVTLTRIGWSWASAPFLGSGYLAANPDSRSFSPQKRVGTVRWFLPRERVLRRYLNPGLVNQERDETQPAMDLYLRSGGIWETDHWGGIMRGISRTGIDLSKSQFVEVWINDNIADPSLRTGRLHIDFGYISEDGFWPVVSRPGLPDSLVVGRHEQEDGIGSDDPDGVWTYNEDIGLYGDDSEARRYGADYEIAGDLPFPRINNTARNNREDNEDLNANGRLDQENGYFTATIDLKDTEPLVDVLRDYSDVGELVAGNIAWRKYRIPLASIDEVSVGSPPNIKAITHVRVWYENPDVGAPNAVHLQFSELRFLGSRWEREGVRRIDGEQLLSRGERIAGEEFFLGEVNNKENPDYVPPFGVHVQNGIPDKEQSLVLNFQELERGHLMRASKQVSPRGDDYTGYREMSWYWYNPSHSNADLDMFFRVGTDSLNFYEVNYRFSDSPVKTGWHRMAVGLAELSNGKNGEMDESGVLHSVIRDLYSDEEYRVRVVGRPDLRRVRRYYFGVANEVLTQPASGYLYINEVRLDGVKRNPGMAQRAGVRLNMADIFKIDFDWKHNDEDFHGLDRRAGSAVDHSEWNLQTGINVEDFFPLAGFRLPVSVARRQSTDRPKYETNSDIEIIDEEVRLLMSTIDKQERFSARLSHAPSKSALLRYMVDPWTMQMSGSRQMLVSPLEHRDSKSLQGGLNFDLRIAGQHTLGSYPLLRRVPIVKGLSLVPRKVAFGASFTASEQVVQTIAESGEVTLRPEVSTRPGKLTGSIDYSPLPIVDMAISANSDRDLLREEKRYGLNIGVENRRSYDVRLTFTMPKGTMIPAGSIFAPMRTAFRGLATLRPSIQFSGGFVDLHDPAQRRLGDPAGIRSVSNTGSWDFRFELPVAAPFKALFPEHKITGSQRAQMLAAQQRIEDQKARSPLAASPGSESEGIVPPQPGGEIGAAGADPSPDRPPRGGAELQEQELLTPEDRQKQEQERLLAAALEREADERAEGLSQPAVADPSTGGTEASFGPMTLFDPVLSLLRNTTPIKVTYTNRELSSYARLLDTASFWYLAGLASRLEVDEARYAASSFDAQDALSLSTASKLSKQVSVDVKYGTSTSRREQVGSESRSRRADWPDAQISVTGLEKWRLLGGGQGPDGGLFRSSSVNLSYKRSLVVNGYTASVYNPTISTTLQPRWSVTFRSGLSAVLSANLNRDEGIANGVITRTRRHRYGLQLRHQFRAENFLAKLGLYRPGSSQNVSMDVDVSYQGDRVDRINPGRANTAPTGSNRINVNPRFSYQISRNLSGAVRFIFGRNKDIASGQSSTTLGLGVEATFVF